MRQLDVIVIGGSAGSLDALLDGLPRIAGALAVPIVVALHIAPGQPSLLPELLAPRLTRPVLEIEDKQPLRAGAIHVAPPDYHVLVERGHTLSLSIAERVNFARPSIDVLFESAAYAFGGATCGILLSGSNADGAAGLAAIAEAGGIAIVQSPATAAFAAMPEAAVARLGGRGHVVAAAAIPDCLLTLVRSTT